MEGSLNVISHLRGCERCLYEVVLVRTMRACGLAMVRLCAEPYTAHIHRAKWRGQGVRTEMPAAANGFGLPLLWACFSLTVWLE